MVILILRAHYKLDMTTMQRWREHWSWFCEFEHATPHIGFIYGGLNYGYEWRLAWHGMAWRLVDIFTSIHLAMWPPPEHTLSASQHCLMCEWFVCVCGGIGVLTWWTRREARGRSSNEYWIAGGEPLLSTSSDRVSFFFLYSYAFVSSHPDFCSSHEAKLQ